MRHSHRSVLPRDVLVETTGLESRLKKIDGIALATSFAELLTIPELQSNCMRLEVLVHLALALARGARRPKAEEVVSLYDQLGRTKAGMFEDPGDDVFVANVSTNRGNYRLLPGAWESAGFYVERAVRALESMPPDAATLEIVENIHAMLKLSEVVCQRAGLSRNLFGDGVPRADMPRHLVQSVGSRPRTSGFAQAELRSNEISAELVRNFTLDPRNYAGLTDEPRGHSMLERRPLVQHRDGILCLLPTAIGTAIRRYLVERINENGLRKQFVGAIAGEYRRLFSCTSLLQLPRYPGLGPEYTDHDRLRAAMIPVDVGVYLHIVFFVDALDDFAIEGMLGHVPNDTDHILASRLVRRIDEAHRAARRRPGFRKGLTLLVNCGFGRGIRDVMAARDRRNWRIEHIRSSDLAALSCLPDFDALSVFRLLDQRDHLRRLGVEVHSPDALVDLVGSALTHGGGLVPHEQLPEAFGSGTDLLGLDPSAGRAVREATTWADPHVAKDPRGTWVPVRGDGPPLFDEDRETPFFVPETYPSNGWPPCVFETPSHTWWCYLETAAGTSGASAFERFKILKTWLCRIVPVLDRSLRGLPEETLQWRVKFEGRFGEDDFAPSKTPSLIEIESAISVHADRGRSTVSLTVGSEFDDALCLDENVSEHALVSSTVKGFVELAGDPLSAENCRTLTEEIVGDRGARHSHGFAAQGFRDMVHETIREPPVRIDPHDYHALKIELGWHGPDIAREGDIVGRDECTGFLNRVVEGLEDGLCKDLRSLDLRAVLNFALTNHERAACQRDLWRRTARALLALHDDKVATRRRIAEKDSEFASAALFSRLLIEAAMGECSIGDGALPGKLDVSRLMAKLRHIHDLGGWSDAIRWGAMEPRLRVSPLGDILGNLDFHESVITPYVRAGIDASVEDAVHRYGDNFRALEPVPVEGSSLPAEFLKAFNDEFGASFDDTRRFIDHVEDLGIRAHSAVILERRSALLSVPDADSRESLGALVEFLSFEVRSAWRELPHGFDEADRFPWRFRRRLSILRRPLIKLSNDDDSLFLIAPGLLREAFVYMTKSYYRGHFPERQLCPSMSRWAGRAAADSGREFTLAVADRLNELGWQTDTEVAVSKLLGMALKRYGDVDVLAWRTEPPRVLVIECKNLRESKTVREIAEQLSDFRGELDSKGKPDHLLRHIRRVDKIKRSTDKVQRYVTLNETPRIEGHVVFSRPVPMKFAWEQMAQRIPFTVMSELDGI